MELVNQNLSENTLLLVLNDEFSKTKKKNLIAANVIVSFVSKLGLPKTTIKTELPHRPESFDVCIIAKDMRKTDFEASNSVWKTKWQSALAKSSNTDVLPVVTFLPISELKLAYQSYEARRKLAATFDVFLADKRIVHHLPTNLGKAFYGGATNKVPIPVTLETNNLIDSIKVALKTNLTLLKGNGSQSSVVVGTTDMPKEHIRENILAVIEGTIAKWPGGLNNLRSIYVRGVGPNVPVYFDNANVSHDAAMNSLASLDGNKVVADMDSGQFLAEQLKAAGSKLPIAAILEVAKSLPLTESQISQIFSTTKEQAQKARVKKAKDRKSISKKSRKPLKSRKFKHHKGKK